MLTYLRVVGAAVQHILGKLIRENTEFSSVTGAVISEFQEAL
jgi:hypothetical protein